MQNVPKEWREEQSVGGARDKDVKPWEGREALFQNNTGNSKQDMSTGKEKKNGEMMNGGGKGMKGTDKESLMMELTRLVQKTVKESSWWERRGIDITILALSFLLLPPGNLYTRLTHFIHPYHTLHKPASHTS